MTTTQEQNTDNDETDTAARELAVEFAHTALQFTGDFIKEGVDKGLHVLDMAKAIDYATYKMEVLAATTVLFMVAPEQREEMLGEFKAVLVDLHGEVRAEHIVDSALRALEKGKDSVGTAET